MVADRPGGSVRSESRWYDAAHQRGDRAAVTAYAGYYNCHRLHGELGWQTPAERFDGTPFTDRGFGSVPALSGIADLLDDLMAA